LYVVTNIFEKCIAYLLKLKINILHTEQKIGQKECKPSWELQNFII